MALKTSVSVGVKALFVFLAGAAATGYATSGAAQTASPSQDHGPATPLPSVTIDAPKPRVQSRTTARSGRAAGLARRSAAPGRSTETARTETSASKGTFQQGTVLSRAMSPIAASSAPRQTHRSW